MTRYPELLELIDILDQHCLECCGWGDEEKWKNIYPLKDLPFEGRCENCCGTGLIPIPLAEILGRPK